MQLTLGTIIILLVLIVLTASGGYKPLLSLLNL